MAKKYGSKVHFVLINTIEAHPKKPDPSPYYGKPWEFQYSNYSQPRNYADRVAVSQHIVDMNKQFTILVDDLTPHNTSGNDPLWCEWGPAPNAAWLIQKSKTGAMKVVLAQSWFQVEAMDKAIAGALDIKSEGAYLKEPFAVTQAKRKWKTVHNSLTKAQ